MSAANTGHSAHDVTAGIRGQLADQPDDETRGALVVAAVDHGQRQLALLEEQFDAVATKADDVTKMWKAKVVEAGRIRDVAAAELAVWQAELDERAGF